MSALIKVRLAFGQSLPQGELLDSVKARNAIALSLAGILALAGCSSPQQPAEPSASVTEQPVEAGTEITVWLNEQQKLGLEVVAAQFFTDTGVSVQLITKEDVVSEILAGEVTPDVIIGSYEAVPELVASGEIQSFEVSNSDQSLNPGSVQAFSFQGQQFGLPVSTENTALVCRSDAFDSAPENFEEVVEAGLAISLNNGAGDPYHFYGIQSSFGAAVFQTDDYGSYLPLIGMENESGFAFASWLFDNKDLFDLESDTRSIKQQLISGEKACWITGPWNGSWFNEQFGESGWNAYPIPAAGPNPATPFLGATGAMLGAQSTSTALATKFIVEYLGSKYGQLALFQGTGLPPANLEALSEATASKIAYEFGMAGIKAVPMPVIDQMDSVWAPWANAQVALIAGVADPIATWQALCDEINAALGY